jgi:hypothetical protein
MLLKMVKFQSCGGFKWGTLTILEIEVHVEAETDNH